MKNCPAGFAPDAAASEFSEPGIDRQRIANR
jgi:hypothetical protein